MFTITPPNLRYRRPLVALRMALSSTTISSLPRRYTLYDLQYLFLFAIFVFCYTLIERPLWIKLPLSVFLIAPLFPQRTRTFMLPFLTIAAWLGLFYACRFIPSRWRPHIFTSVLPTLDNILYGENLSGLLASSTSPWKDLLAWLPYGIFHFVMPVIVAMLIAIFAPGGTLPVFARTFGYMNIAGVITQLIFPCAPPWFETRYGPLQPAAYSMPGDPGGLARVDDLLGTDMYRNTFTASPLVFGAFPSLHSGCAWQLAFFTVFVFGPRALPVALAYVLWIWWSAMYLGHHYVVDLVGGAIYAVFAFWIGSKFLPPLTTGGGSMIELTEKNGLDVSSALAMVVFDGCQDVDMVEKDGDNQIESEISTDTLVLTILDERQKEAATMVQQSRIEGTQQWNTWNGYELWIEVLSTINSPSSSTPSRTRSPSPLQVLPTDNGILQNAMATTEATALTGSAVCSKDISRITTSITLSSSSAAETFWHQMADVTMQSPARADFFEDTRDISLTHIPSLEQALQKRILLDSDTSITAPLQSSTSLPISSGRRLKDD
ncbi:Aureobasidin resistance protein Aur1 [Mortierella alpina]|nr:Aureobasidin resistance protein Aur1 [Mortierella alpina]